MWRRGRHRGPNGRANDDIRRTIGIRDHSAGGHALEHGGGNEHGQREQHHRRFADNCRQRNSGGQPYTDRDYRSRRPNSDCSDRTTDGDLGSANRNDEAATCTCLHRAHGWAVDIRLSAS